MKSAQIRNWLLLAGAAVLFSTGGAAIKSTSLNAWQVASFRSAVAAIVVWSVLPEARRDWNWRLLPVGAAYAATMLLFVLATKLTTAANAIFLQSTAPLYVLLLGPLLLREPVRRPDWLFILAVAGGIALVFGASERAVATAPDPGRGNLIAAASGVAWALTVCGLRWTGRAGKTGGSMAAVVSGNLIAFGIALPLALPVSGVHVKDAAVVLYLGVFQVGIAYVCLTRALRRVTALEAATVLLLEPALNPIWAWLVHGERPSAGAVAGGAVILAASLSKAWWQNRTPSDRFC
jgi:drug/metabolite transporter, DME family